MTEIYLHIVAHMSLLTCVYMITTDDVSRQCGRQNETTTQDIRVRVHIGHARIYNVGK